MYWIIHLLHDGRTNLAFAGRAFSHAAPAVWNSLPLDVVSDLSCLATFKRLVKTELYNRAYLRWFVTTRTYDSSLCERPNVRHQTRNNNNNNSYETSKVTHHWCDSSLRWLIIGWLIIGVTISGVLEGNFAIARHTAQHVAVTCDRPDTSSERYTLA